MDLKISVGDVIIGLDRRCVYKITKVYESKNKFWCDDYSGNTYYNIDATIEAIKSGEIEYIPLKKIKEKIQLWKKMS